jgi:hypothetical protein
MKSTVAAFSFLSRRIRVNGRDQKLLPIVAFLTPEIFPVEVEVNSGRGDTLVIVGLEDAPTDAADSEKRALTL